MLCRSPQTDNKAIKKYLTTPAKSGKKQQVVNIYFKKLFENKQKDITDFPCGSVVESTCNAGDMGSVPGWGRSPGRGHGNPLQCSCLENPHGQRSPQATVH